MKYELPAQLLVYSKLTQLFTTRNSLPQNPVLA